MTWGFFSTLHIITILFAAGMIIALFYILKNKSAKTQTITLLLCSTICIYNAFYDFSCSTNFWAALPLHLCGLNAVLLPFAISTRNKTINNLLLLWALGALAAIIVNTAQAHFTVPSAEWARYYFSHVFEFGIPILMFKLRLVKKDCQCIFSTLIITLVAYTLVHIYNYCVVTYTEVSTNFMYSMHPDNPIFDFFYKLIPHPYWYLYLVLPIALVYLSLVYSKQIMEALRNRKKQKQLNHT